MDLNYTLATINYTPATTNYYISSRSVIAEDERRHDLIRQRVLALVQELDNEKTSEFEEAVIGLSN